MVLVDEYLSIRKSIAPYRCGAIQSAGACTGGSVLFSYFAMFRSSGTTSAASLVARCRITRAPCIAMPCLAARRTPATDAFASGLANPRDVVVSWRRRSVPWPSLPPSAPPSGFPRLLGFATIGA